MAVNSFNAQNPPVNTKGDVFTFSTIPTRLGVGANNTVLTADSSTATGLKWAAPSAGANWSIVNSGGTALTGAQTITISGISSADKLMIIVVNASSASASSYIGIQMNADTGNNYYNYGALFSASSTYSNTYVTRQALEAEPYIYFARLSNNAASTATGSITFQGCNSSGIKTFMNVGGAATGGGNDAQFYLTQGYYNSASTISSVSIYSSVGNFDGGTIYVYKSAQENNENH